MNTKSREQFEAAVEVFNNLGEARKKLMGHELTSQLFAEINGVDRGLEVLLGRNIVVPTEVVAAAQLKKEIFDAIENQEIEAGKQMHAAMECYLEDLVTTCQKFDAYMEENAELRAKLSAKIDALSDDGKEKFLHAVCDFYAFQYTNADEICTMMSDFGHFLGSSQCNLGILTRISTTQGGDMTDEDKKFLGELEDAIQENSRSRYHKIDVAYGDRLRGASVESLGYDAKKVEQISKALTKAEMAFFKTVRQFREALCHDTTPTDQLAVRNTRFWMTMDRIGWQISSLSEVGRNLAENIALFSKMIDLLGDHPEAPTEDDKKDDPDNQSGEQKKDETSSEGGDENQSTSEGEETK